MAAASSEGWVRPLGLQEQYSEMLHQKGSLVISYIARVATSRPVTGEDLSTVLTSLYRKTPPLRMCIQKRDERYWMREMKQEKIDFKVVNSSDPNEAFIDMSHYHFDEEGPLWAARLLPWSPSHADYVTATKMEDTAADGQLDNVSHIVVAYHHGITDGHTCKWILQHILTLLNDVLSGNPIDDSEQFAELIDTVHETRLIKELEEKLKSDPQLLEERDQSFKSSLVQTLFEEVYPVDISVKPHTLAIPHIVDSALSKKFTARCKQEGVTFHTGFSSVIQAAVVRVLTKGTTVRDSYVIPSFHTVNQRAYFNVSEKSYGCGMGVMDLSLDTPRDVLDNFWPFAREYHAKFKDQYARKNSIEHYALPNITGERMTRPFSTGEVPDQLPKFAYYCTSNMLDVSKCLGEVGEHVRLQYYERVSDISTAPTHCLISFQSFRGQITHSLAYNVHSMGHEAAAHFSDAIFQVLAQVA